MKTIETIAVIGAGALGVMYGKQLAEKLGKEKVWFIADQPRIMRYEQEGIFCNGKRCDFHYESGKDQVQKADLIIFAVKFTAIQEAISLAAPFVGEDTLMISLLNGIASEELIKDVFGAQRVIYCVAQGMDALKEGNRVSYHNMGVLVIGITDEKQKQPFAFLTELLDRTGITYSVSEDILHHLWSKMMLNTGVNQVCSVMNLSYSGVQQDGPARQLMREAMKEVQRVATYEDVHIKDEEIDGWFDIVDTLNPKGMPSMRQDIVAGRKTEVELFAGTTRKLGKKHGIATPINDDLYDKIKKIENEKERNKYDLSKMRKP